MDLIYRPKGRAGEYSRWAANPYEGCRNACEYCFGPTLLPWRVSGRDRAEYHYATSPKSRVIERLQADLQQLAQVEPEANVLLSFTSDLYPPDEHIRLISGELLACFDLPPAPGVDLPPAPGFTVLTKGGMRAAEHFGLYAPGRDVFASSIIWTDDDDRGVWEPNAAPLDFRWDALDLAHGTGIETWISIEPVIDTDQALAVVEKATDYGVGHVRVGPLNYHPRAATIDWKRFGTRLAETLARAGIPYYIKEDLRPHMPPGFGPFDTREGASCAE